jgi:hypothetical protein
MFMRNVIPA